MSQVSAEKRNGVCDWASFTGRTFPTCNGKATACVASSCSRKPRISASERCAPPTALVWPHARSRTSHRTEPLPTHVLSAVHGSPTTSDIMDMLRGHAAAASPVSEATAVGGLIGIALSVAWSWFVLEATIKASCWPTVGLCNDSNFRVLGSSCVWCSFYLHALWWRSRESLGLIGPGKWLVVELRGPGGRCRSDCEQESDRE